MKTPLGQLVLVPAVAGGIELPPPETVEPRPAVPEYTYIGAERELIIDAVLFTVAPFAGFPIDPLSPAFPLKTLAMFVNPLAPVYEMETYPVVDVATNSNVKLMFWVIANPEILAILPPLPAPP